MKRYSLFTCLLISFVLIAYRIYYPGRDSARPLMVTTWDALGYYFYLPSVFIYEDVSQLNWFPAIDSTYSVSGGHLYQAGKCKNGNYVFNYFGGIAIMQSPFFFLAHGLAKLTGHPSDGFSPPYQYLIAFSAVAYCIFAIFLLRTILLRYFDELTVALTLLLLLLASNFIQYVSIDSAMSHGFIFSLYGLVLYATMRWHERPAGSWAGILGFAMGLAVICRPSEIIIFFIPLLWSTNGKEPAALKWAMVKKHRSHLVIGAVCGFIAMVPQMVYWKITSGSFIYDVGSKWEFLSPHFRVLFGWEKGWFIYTPVALLFAAGLFFMKNYPFKRSVLTFSLLNIWIIIAWHDWRYGASYSCRALVQSYPVFALALGALVQQIGQKKWRYGFYLADCYLVFVNLFQIWQYNDVILHYDDMNRKYYSAIYLNPNPSPLDMSLLDTDELIEDETVYGKSIWVKPDSAIHLKISPYASAMLFQDSLHRYIKENDENWIRIESEMNISRAGWGEFLNSELQVGDSIKHNKIRLQNAISPLGGKNAYVFYVKVPAYFNKGGLKVFITAPCDFEADVNSLKLIFLSRSEE